MALQDVGIGIQALRAGQQDLLRALGSYAHTGLDVGLQMHTLLLIVANLTADMEVMNGRLDQIMGSVMALEGKSRQQGDLCVETKSREVGWSGDYIYIV